MDEVHDDITVSDELRKLLVAPDVRAQTPAPFWAAALSAWCSAVLRQRALRREAMTHADTFRTERDACHLSRSPSMRSSSPPRTNRSSSSEYSAAWCARPAAGRWGGAAPERRARPLGSAAKERYPAGSDARAPAGRRRGDVPVRGQCDAVHRGSQEARPDLPLTATSHSAPLETRRSCALPPSPLVFIHCTDAEGLAAVPTQAVQGPRGRAEESGDAER